MPTKIRSQSEQRKDFLGQCYGSGEWEMVPKRFLSILNPLQTIVLSYLINLSDVCGGDDDFFYCRIQKLCADLFCSISTQTRIIHDLNERRFISIEHRGNPAKRWFKINRENIEDALKKKQRELMKKGGVYRDVPCAQSEHNVLPFMCSK